MLGLEELTNENTFLYTDCYPDYLIGIHPLCRFERNDDWGKHGQNLLVLWYRYLSYLLLINFVLIKKEAPIPVTLARPFYPVILPVPNCPYLLYRSS